MATPREKIPATEQIEDASHLKELAEDLQDQARHGAEIEQNLSFRQAIRIYWKAVLWSVAVSMATVMESYDIQIIGSFYAYPEFQKKYGVQLANGTYSIPASWQVALSLGSTVGIIIGIFANGFLVDRFGHRLLLLYSYVFMTGFIFITFLSPNIQVLLAGEVLCGLPWGIFNTIAPSYAVEVCPVTLRGYLTTYVNLCWVIGHLIAAGVLDGLVGNQTQWGYRIPFAIQWLWPVPLFIIMCFAPDSPWWLVRKQRLADAEKALRRLCSASSNLDTKQLVAMMKYTDELEQAMNVGTSYLDCFKGTNRRRTEIACVSWAGQGIVGFAIQGYATYFFELAGFNPHDAYKLGLGSYSIAFTGTTLSWFLLAYFGRRTIYLGGLLFMGPLMWIIGFLSFGPAGSRSFLWAQAILLLVWFGGYGLTIGPVAWVIASEVSAGKMRNKTIGVARNFYYLILIVNAVVAPYMLNPKEGNWKGKAAFPAAVMSLFWFLWAYFRLPETKGRTYAELDVLFEKKVSARCFKGYQVDAYDQNAALEDVKDA